jgi:hypothetical protein
VLRFWGIGFGLPHDFSRPDEERITDAALGIFQGDLNPHFFLYPTFFIYVTAAAYAVLFTIQRAIGTTASVADFVASAIADPSSLHLTARLLAASAGVATIAVVYAAGRELFSSRAALAAAAFVAVAFLHVRDSHFGVTDVPVSLMAVCAFWAAVRCATDGVTLVRAASAGLLCGLAASTKYNAALVAAPVLVAMLSDTFERRDDFTRRLLAAILVFASCLALGFLVGTPFALLDRSAFLADLDSQRRIVLGLQSGSILDPARQVYGVPGWIHHASFSLRYGLGLPLLLTTVAGACWLAFRQPVRAALVLSFPLAYYASMGISLLAYARYMVPIVPFLCLVAGEAVDRAAQVLERILGAKPAAAGAAVLVMLIGASTAAQAVAFDRLVATTDTRVLGARWIQEHFPEGTTLYQTGTFYGHLEPRPASRYKLDAFDDRHARFLVGDQPAPSLPELVVVLDSPLVVYNHVPERLGAVLDAHYRLVTMFQGIAAPAAAQALYDQQDAFYVPFAKLQGIRRPGPGVRIFQRRPAQ